jgi:hypothetical protein
MTRATWDVVGQRFFETGVDRGMLYLPDPNTGIYDSGFAWSGLTTVTESPSGAEPNPQYADNIKYVNLQSYEEYGGSIEAFTYPEEFAQCDGSAAIEAGVYLGQQTRQMFGFSWRSRLGNDLKGPDYGYKLHLVYGALATPSEKAHATLNDSPEATALSWDFTTTPVDVGTINSVEYKPSAYMCIESPKVSSADLSDLEDFLYGTVGTDPSLPLPAAVYAIFAGGLTTVTPTAPTYNSSTDEVTIPTITGITYRRMDTGAVVTGNVVITASTVFKAFPNVGYRFPAVIDDDWLITFA